MSDPATPDLAGLHVEVKNSALQYIASEAAYRIAERLQKRVEELVETKLNAILNEAWEASVQAKAQKAIDAYLTKSRQKTNEWGEPVPGPAEQLADRIPRAVESWMGQPVDAKGQPAMRGYDQKHPSRLQWMLQTLVVNELKRETEKAAKDVTEKARQVVANHVGRFISEQMVPAIDVQKQ